MHFINKFSATMTDILKLVIKKHLFSQFIKIVRIRLCLFNLMTISQILSNSSFQVSNFTTVLIHTMHVIYD